jgi:hypothetical protein
MDLMLGSFHASNPPLIGDRLNGENMPGEMARHGQKNNLGIAKYCRWRGIVKPRRITTLRSGSTTRREARAVSSRLDIVRSEDAGGFDRISISLP